LLKEDIMPFTDLADIKAREIVPGFHGKFVHSDHMTISFWEVEAGAVLPDHAHPHEQITTVLEGKFELTVAGETRVVGPGEVAIIPGQVKHSGRAITPCRLLDVFYPCREDYR
jgi:quercetin dioxygenase-like cupin family protein